MSVTEVNWTELNERITTLFEAFKEELNGQEVPNVNYLLYYVNNATDNLLYQVKYEIEEFMKSRLKQGEFSAEARSLALKNKKAECLIKMQTLTSELTCRIMEDFTNQKKNM